MNEIEKMYENAGIGKRMSCFFTCSGETCSVDCEHFEKLDMSYPPFTSEKQIELIKLLIKHEDFCWTIAQQGKDTKYVFYVGYEHSSGDFKEFTEAIAGIINDLWQDLTDAEKQQIKEILE